MTDLERTILLKLLRDREAGGFFVEWQSGSLYGRTAIELEQQGYVTIHEVDKQPPREMQCRLTEKGLAWATLNDI